MVNLSSNHSIAVHSIFCLYLLFKFFSNHNNSISMIFFLGNMLRLFFYIYEYFKYEYLIKQIYCLRLIKININYN